MAFLDWYHKVAYRLTKLWVGQKQPDAQFNMGYLYYIGKGVAQDYAEAAKWYRRAADQGHTSAQFNLGFLYKNGLGVPRDKVLAHMWFDLAASRAKEWRQMEEEAKKSRDAVASSMIPAQIAEARKLAGEWKPKKER